MSLSKASLIVVGALTAIAVPSAYYATKLRRLHHSLSSAVTHRSSNGVDGVLALERNELTSLPKDVVASESQYLVVFDEAYKTIKASCLPCADEQILLTSYLRYNFTKFSTTPQAWILWLVSGKEAKRTFEPAYISKLNFERGDRVCGEYAVEHRQSNRVEMGMHLNQASSDEHIEGRLVISVQFDNERDHALFKTQTFMWRKRTSKTFMPLERALPRWAHELTSWWLIDQGVKYLNGMNSEKTS